MWEANQRLGNMAVFYGRLLAHCSSTKGGSKQLLCSKKLNMIDYCGGIYLSADM